ncbi:hypothetical protein AAFC00_004779 [Neodothiora populina]
MSRDTPESRLDEGYSGGSEETRSLSGSDASMRLEADTDMDKMQLVNSNLINHLMSLPAEDRAALAATIILGLPETEKSDAAYAVIRSLRTSSIASIVERLNPLLHKDPAMTLPPEITALIFLYLPPVDLLRSAISSKAWRERALDSNLWRVLFTREGWSANMNQVRAAEAMEARRRATLTRHTSPKAPRRKRDLDSEGTGSTKRARESSSHQTISGGPGESASEGWREQHGTLEADEDFVMLEYQPNDSEEIRNDADSVSGSNARACLSPTLHPELFTPDTLFPRINWLYLYKQRRRLEDNWHKGRYVTFQLPHPDHLDEAHEECVYTIQHSSKWVVSGSRDKTIAIWDLATQRRVRTLSGAHHASVLCLQFDESESEDIVVSGGSDSFVVIWRFSTGEIIRKLDQAHTESVLNLRFDHRYLITCSKDKTIKIWNRREVFVNNPIVPAVARRQIEVGGPNLISEYNLLVTLEGHGAAVNAIQVYEGQIVSASGDRTIKAWDINTGYCLRTYTGHTKGIACVQYDGRRIVSGSSDNTVRIFDAATSAEVACLPGHTNLVRTVQARFGDMQDTDQDLEAAARAVDQAFHDARTTGQTPDARRRRGLGNAGSSNPNDVCALGAKIPPGGGGNAWSRIVSGSYDETIIIWRKDVDGKWVPSRRLHQDEILSPRHRRTRPIHPQPLGFDDIPIQSNVPPATRHRPADTNNGSTAQSTAGAVAGVQTNTTNVRQAQVGEASTTANGVPPAAAARPDAAAQPRPFQQVRPPGAGVHVHRQQRLRELETNRVFKLQFDSRRIISCSQNRIIVGWDFAAGDAELAEASRFFGETN